MKELVPYKIFKGIWGSRYKGIKVENNRIRNVPVFCMDETMKTRAIFEICKGSFFDHDQPVNKRVEEKNLWCPFENLIYVGDGDTDIPALSLTRERGGYGIVVYNAQKNKKEIEEKLENMSADKRCDLITKAEFNLKSELFISIKTKCEQILQKYEAEDFSIS